MIVCIEGTDGVGKRTQALSLAKALSQRGFKVHTESFPQYQGFFGQVIGEYLQGQHGAVDSISPKFTAMMYAMDRFFTFRSSSDLLDADFVVFDRYIPSNIAYQVAKAPKWERMVLRSWIEELEYEQMGNPRADVVILLDADPAAASERVLNKDREKRGQAEGKDMHEQDLGYLSAVRDVYLELAENDATFRKVDCEREGRLKTREEIQRAVWRHMMQYKLICDTYTHEEQMLFTSGQDALF